MKKFLANRINLILILIILADLVFSFLQHLQMPLEGDLVQGLLNESTGWQILNDPLGIKAISANQVVPDPNRFFVPLTLQAWFFNMPFWLQSFLSPIESVYWACALFKILVQIGLIFILAKAISGFERICTKNLLIAAVIVVPLFQTYGIVRTIGVIDPSITYTFFYAFPIFLLAIMFLPYFKHEFYGRPLRINVFSKIIITLLAVYLSFHGPIIPGVVAVLCLIIYFYHWQKFKKQNPSIGLFARIWHTYRQIPGFYQFLIFFFCILCIYSLYIGMANATFFANTPSLIERYKLLPKGIIGQLSDLRGQSLLIIVTIANMIIIKRKAHDSEGKKIIRFANWLLLFSSIFLLLLPLGGYRDCRPFLIRYDSILPITLGIFFIYGISTVFIINKTHKKFKKIYIGFIVLLSAYYTVLDDDFFYQNNCEKQAMQEIANSPDKIVELHSDCSVISWGLVTDYTWSEQKTEMMYRWGITKEKKWFYQKLP